MIKPTFKKLKPLLKNKSFWVGQSWQLGFLGVIITFWGGQIWATLTGTPPPIAWMISAEIAVVMIAWLSAEVFLQAKTQTEQHVQGMLLVQFAAIILGNSLVIAIEGFKGVAWTPTDTRILLADACGLAVVGILLAFRVFHWKSPWARCGYGISLKVVPQFFTGWGIFTGETMLTWLVIAALVAQCAGRLLPSIVSAHAEHNRGKISDPTLSQLVTTGADQVSSLFIGAGALSRS
ncbi:MAG TPA: hypothetical protein VFO38_02685 [Candidatus Saccharimonadales bacterium]|nr:hypothetical protein [Candidatus Saccharimonadales bacterium]